ncbi:MAG: patatin-like phospholipase family protein [Burkholderiaceae bacterium]
MPSSQLADQVVRALSPIADETPTDVDANEIGLCLSGGGYRAMLFHVGVLWRLNELGWLTRLTRVSSVSGGSITAGVLGLNWSKLAFDGSGVATQFVANVVDPLRKMADTSIDVSSVIAGALLPGVSISDRVTRKYKEVLFGDATLQALPDEPRFTFCATNVQTASLFRLSKKRAADWQVGELVAPTIPLARAVAASSAFPPVLSPCEIELPSPLQPFADSTLGRPPFTTDLVLADGGVYDNLGIEPVWKNCGTVLVSDAGQKIDPEEEPAQDWARHTMRVLNLIDNQVRALRKRQVVGSYVVGLRKGAYWGIRTNIQDYQLATALPCPFDRTLDIAATPTRLTSLDAPTQERLINWGYAVCDAGMRAHVVTDSAVAPQFPYARGVG